MIGIELNQENDIVVRNGSLALSETSEQNAQLIVCANKGEFKEFPQLGVGIINFLKTTNSEKTMLREIKVQLALDGIKDAKISFNNSQIKIDL